MKVILYNIANNDRINLYKHFFQIAGFEFLGLISDNDNFDYGNNNKITFDDLQKTEFDLIMTHNNQIALLRNKFIELGLPLSKTRIIYYDFNNVQKILGTDNIKNIFYDDYEIIDNKLIHRLKHKKLLGRYTETSSQISDSLKNNIVHEVYSSYKKQIKDTENEEPIYKPGRNWGNYMKLTRPEFYNAVKNDDENCIRELLPLFFRNCMSTGMFGGEEAYNAFITNKDLYGLYFDNFKVWQAKSINKKPDINELGLKPEGGIYGINIEGNIININSFMFHSRAEMCMNLLGNSDKSIIAEIGGGSGLLGYYLMKIKANVTYIDFDLPDNLISASYYLKVCYPDKKILIYDSKEILSREKLLKYDIVLMPNYMIKNLEKNSVDMFVNTISFGEMNYDTICEYYRQIERSGRMYFYQENIFAPQGDYECYPINTYPDMNTFSCLYSTASPWAGIFDSTNKNHMYAEKLYKKKVLLN